MSTILYKKLDIELVQTITFTGKRESVAAFCPWLLSYNSPAGTFIFSVYKDTELIFSKSFTNADIKTSLSTLLDYSHVFYAITTDGPVIFESGNYSFKLTASGYSPSENSFLGWCQQFENVQNNMNYTPSSDGDNSLAFRIKKYR